MTENIVTSFVGKITELLSVLITNQFEEFSKDLMKKIEEKEIQNIEDIRSLWNSKCKENVLNISNCSISLKIKNNSKNEIDIGKTFPYFPLTAQIANQILDSAPRPRKVD